MTFKVRRLSLLAYVREAWLEKRAFPALAYLPEWGTAHILGLYARVPFFGERALAHERWHDSRRVGNSAHAAWYTFDVKCGHALRLFDRDGLVAEYRKTPKVLV